MRIQIIGGSGTGKSTLGSFIAEKENLPWLDTDTYLWKDTTFTENHPLEKRIQLYEEDMKKYSSYVASGSTYGWLKEGFNNRDILVFLYLAEEDRMERLREREIQRVGTHKMDINEKGFYTNNFLNWCETYTTETDKTKMGTLAEHKHQLAISKSPTLQLNAHNSLENLYQLIIKALSKPL